MSQLDPALVSNIILGTVPIGGALLAFLLHIEHRITRLETKIEDWGLCNHKDKKPGNHRS